MGLTYTHAGDLQRVRNRSAYGLWPTAYTSLGEQLLLLTSVVVALAIVGAIALGIMVSKTFED